MFFRPEDYLRMRDRVAAKACDVPIIAGVMPVTNARQITRIVQLSGQAFPADLAERFAALDGDRPEDKAAVRAFGVEVATELCRTLLAEGVPGIHFITMNRSTATREVYLNLVPETAATALTRPPRTVAAFAGRAAQALLLGGVATQHADDGQVGQRAVVQPALGAGVEGVVDAAEQAGGPPQRPHRPAARAEARPPDRCPSPSPAAARPARRAGRGRAGRGSAGTRARRGR